jgi:hypothetical protein
LSNSSRLQRTGRIVWGTLLIAFGTWISWSFGASIYSRIGLCHSLLKYIGLGVYFVLLLIGFLYITAGIMLLRRRHHLSPRWRMLIGLLTGLLVWFALATAVVACASTLRLTHFYWPRDVIPLLIAACLSGYISRRFGLAWGGILGVTHQLAVLWWIWASFQGDPYKPYLPITKIIDQLNLLPSIVINTLIVLLIGMASGYLGQFLAQRVLRRRNSSDQETSSARREA